MKKIIPRNLYWLTTGISESSNFNVGLSCIFLNWQKCTHWVFVLEILNPFMVAHLLILLILCCSWRSAVHIYLLYIYIYIASIFYLMPVYVFACLYIIIIIMSRRLRGYPWPSLAISPYHSSPPAGLQGYIPCRVVFARVYVISLPQAGYVTRSIVKQVTTGLNLDFSFT